MQRLLHTYTAGRAAHRIDTIQYYRYLYNIGKLYQKKEPRKGPIAFKYNSDGDRINTQPNSSKVLAPEEIEAILIKFGPDSRRSQDFNWHVQAVHPVRKPLGKPCYESFDWVI